MLPELLRHSDRKDVLDLIPEHLKKVHRPEDVSSSSTLPVRSLPPLSSALPRRTSLWGEGVDGWGATPSEGEDDEFGGFGEENLDSLMNLV